MDEVTVYLTQEYLHQILSYDAASGEFTWLVTLSNKGNAGTIAGHLIKRDGYKVIGIHRRHYRAHRLAWFYVHGEWPSRALDHANGNRADNRLQNLRLATISQNAANSKTRKDNTSGGKGVSWHKPQRKWRAYINVGKKQKHLGLFGTREEAAAAYALAAKEFYGDFARPTWTK